MPAYVRPPIVESFIELRFSAPIKRVLIEKCRRKASKIYPVTKAEFKIPTLQIKISKEGKLSAQQVEKLPKVYKMETVDAENVFQLQDDLIWVGCRAPYPGWESFFGSFNKIWSVFEKVVGARTISRIGVRFINRIDVPQENEEGLNLAEYLNYGVISPVDSPIDGFNIAMGINLEDGYKCRLLLASGEAVLPNTAAVILDIDIFKEGQFILEKKELYGKLSKIRGIKNDLFEQIITDKSRSLFNQEVH